MLPSPMPEELVRQRIESLRADAADARRGRARRVSRGWRLTLGMRLVSAGVRLIRAA